MFGSHQVTPASCAFVTPASKFRVISRKQLLGNKQVAEVKWRLTGMRDR